MSASDGLPFFLLCPDSPELYRWSRPPRSVGIPLPFPKMVIVPPTGADGLPTIVGLGVRARCCVRLPAGGIECVPFMLVPLGAIARTPLSLATSINVIEGSYSRMLHVALRNHSKENYVIRPRDALFQLLPCAVWTARAAVVSEDHPAFATAGAPADAGAFVPASGDDDSDSSLDGEERRESEA